MVICRVADSVKQKGREACYPVRQGEGRACREVMPKFEGYTEKARQGLMREQYLSTGSELTWEIEVCMGSQTSHEGRRTT